MTADGSLETALAKAKRDLVERRDRRHARLVALGVGVEIYGAGEGIVDRLLDRADELTVELNALRLMVGNARHGKHVAGEIAAELRQALAAKTGDAVSLPATRVRFLAEMLLGVSLGVHSPASFATSRTADDPNTTSPFCDVPLPGLWPDARVVLPEPDSVPGFLVVAGEREPGGDGDGPDDAALFIHVHHAAPSVTRLDEDHAEEVATAIAAAMVSRAKTTA